MTICYSSHTKQIEHAVKKVLGKFIDLFLYLPFESLLSNHFFRSGYREVTCFCFSYMASYFFILKFWICLEFMLHMVYMWIQCSFWSNSQSFVQRSSFKNPLLSQWFEMLFLLDHVFPPVSRSRPGHCHVPTLFVYPCTRAWLFLLQEIYSLFAPW